MAQLDAGLTGDQEDAGSIPAGSATFFRGDWSSNIFFGHSLHSAGSIKKGSCQFLVKEFGQLILVNRLED